MYNAIYDFKNGVVKNVAARTTNAACQRALVGPQHDGVEVMMDEAGITSN